MPDNRQGSGIPKRKAPKTAFRKGVSGNPGGRPKRTQEELDLIAACKEKTHRALAVIEDIMERGDSDKVRLSAALAIIERAWGKPEQPVDHRGSVVLRLNDDDARI